MVGLLLNAVTLAVSVAIVIVFRIMDRDNRSLDKLKRYAASLQEEIDGIVEKSVQELKNTALDLEVNTRAGRELLSDVNREDSRLTEIQERIGGLENSVRNSETAMDQLAGLTQSVEENMRNLRRESDFVTAVAKKVKEIDERTQAIRSEMDEVLNEFEAKASDSLERISREVRDDFEEEKKECLRSIEDTKESAERDWAAYVSGEKESFDRAADEIREFVRTISEEGTRISDEAVSRMNEGAAAAADAFRSVCGESLQSQQDKIQSVRESLARALEELTDQVENVKFAHRESMTQIQSEKEQMEELFLQLRQKSAELTDQTAAQMKEDSRKATAAFKADCESLQRENREHADGLKNSFQETLSSVSAQLESVKGTHEAALNRLNTEKMQMLALVAGQREKLEERIKKEIASVLSGVKEKTDTYTAIFDAKVADAKSRVEKDLSVLQEKQNRNRSVYVRQMETLESDIEKLLGKFKTQAEEVETRYQRNIQSAMDRSLRLEDDIFENLRHNIEERAAKSEKQLESHLASLFANIETTNEEILRHFGEMRGEVEMKKEESKKDLEQLKTSISAALHEADAFNRSNLTRILEEAETSRKRLREDLDSFIERMNSEMDSFRGKITDELNLSETRLNENTRKLDHISSEIDTSGTQMIESASARFNQSLNLVTAEIERKITELNRLFEDHKTHLEYKVSQIDEVESSIGRYMEEVSVSLEKAGKRNEELLESFAAEAQERRESERAKTEEGYREIHQAIENIGKEIESIKAAAYESTDKQMSIYEDQFFADLRERTDALNLKVLEWQQQTEKDMERILLESRAHQAEAEEQRRAAIAEGLKKIEEQTDRELLHLNSRIQSLQDKIASDSLRNEQEVEEFKIQINKNIEGIRNEAQNAFEVEFSKYDMSIAARLGEYQKNLDGEIESVKGKLEENISDILKRNETAYSDLKVMHSNVIQQMKNTEADLKAKYADLKTSVSENVNIIKDSFATQKDGVLEKAKRDTEELAKAVLIVSQDVEKMGIDLRQKSDDALIELNKKYDEFYAEFNYKTDTLLNELDYKIRDFRQSSADTREKIEAVQQKLHNDVEEGRKNLSFRLDEITKRIRDFESQTKLFERADSMKKKLTDDIASLRNEIDQLVIKKKEFKDIDVTLAKVKAIEADVTGKLGQLQANKRIVDDLEKDFKRLRDTSAEINSRIDKVTASNDAVMEMQARLRQLDELERTVEDQYTRLEKKEHVLNHTTMGIDKNFEEMQELETRLKNFEISFNDFLGKLAGASKRIESLSNNKERADFAVEKLMDLDSMLADIDAKIESVTKARKWLADTESRLVQLNDSAVKNLTTLKEVTELSNFSGGKGKVDRNALILRLAQQGWSAADIAKKLNIGLGEVQLIIETNLNK